MKIYEYCPETALPINTGTVIALGFFDGVHIAHRDLIKSARAKADMLGIPLGIFTFPAENALKIGTPRIYGTADKLKIFDSLGVDFTVLADFDELSGYSPEKFVNGVLINGLHAELAVAGYNFRFGKGAIGNAEMLADLMRNAGKSADILDEFTSGGITVSASLIREYITKGDIEAANKLLGTPYFMTSTVSHGRRLGRKLGFPTVNTSLPITKSVPHSGVYRTAIPIDGIIYNAVTNVGTCPTFGEREMHAETYIIDFDGDLYEKDITVYFLGYLRGETRFSTQKELIMQINIDKSRAIKENGDITWQELGLK